MDKCIIRDDEGEFVGWFDSDRAREWPEGKHHDGSNWISLATGSQWNHESLYRTARGKWVLCAWSQWQGSGPATYTSITDDQAAAWLLRNEHETDSSREMRAVVAAIAAREM